MNINQEIENLDWSKAPKGLYEPIGYILAAGGKRIRPNLCMTGAEIFTSNIPASVKDAAIALEIFHNFTLLHDDIMDQAQVRRGRACVHVKWNTNTAILSGDQMLIEAYKRLALLPAQQIPHVLHCFNKMATEVCEGQQYDVDFENQPHVTIEQYIEMIRLKTSVLLATALQTGAYLGGANNDQQDAIYQYGIHLGLAFQIQDDYLDCYGDECTFGKAIGGDIREGKKTWLWLTAEQQTHGKDTRLYSRDMQQVLGVYKENNIAQQALEEIDHLTEQALTYLNQLPQNESCNQLRQLASNLVNRKA